VSERPAQAEVRPQTKAGQAGSTLSQQP